MKDYTEEALKTGTGGTPALCQDALIELLREILGDKKYEAPEESRKLKFFKQELDRPVGDDADTDTNGDSAPYVLVRMEGGEIPDDNSTQLVEFSIEICAYDDSGKNDGYRDVMNITEKITQKVCSAPYFGGCFTILKPFAWAIRKDMREPYYFGACVLTCTAPALTQDKELWRLV